MEPEISVDPLVERLNLVEKENDDLKKENEDLKKELKRTEEAKMTLEFDLADIVDDHNMKMEDHNMKMDEMRLKIKRIRKYAINQEAWYHYAVGSIFTLVAILIAFVVGFKFFR